MVDIDESLRTVSLRIATIATRWQKPSRRPEEAFAECRRSSPVTGLEKSSLHSARRAESISCQDFPVHFRRRRLPNALTSCRSADALLPVMRLEPPSSGELTHGLTPVCQMHATAPDLTDRSWHSETQDDPHYCWSLPANIDSAQRITPLQVHLIVAPGRAHAPEAVSRERCGGSFRTPYDSTSIVTYQRRLHVSLERSRRRHCRKIRGR